MTVPLGSASCSALQTINHAGSLSVISWDQGVKLHRHLEIVAATETLPLRHPE